MIYEAHFWFNFKKDFVERWNQVTVSKIISLYTSMKKYFLSGSVVRSALRS